MPTMTISGLASGLDTDKIIQQLMEIERVPVTRLERRKVDLEVDSNAWGDIGTRLKSLLDAVTPLRDGNVFKARMATSSDPQALTATATTAAVPGTYKIWIDKLAQAHKVASDPVTGVENGGSFTIAVGTTSKTVSVAAGASLETVRNEINNQAGDIVTATIVGGRLVITSKVMGRAGQMTFADSNGVLFELGILERTTNQETGEETVRIKNELLQAQDAKFSVDRLVFERSTNTVDDVIPGVTLNLLNVTNLDADDDIDPGEEIILEITKNTRAAVDAVQKFKEQYNSAMDLIASKLGKTATGEPGDLFGDPTLARIQQQLRKLVFDRVNLSGTKYTSAGAVGISTGTGLDFDRSGKLTLDEAKFTKALEEDPAAVEQLFTSEKLEGIAVRLENYLKKVIQASAGTYPGPDDGAISSKQKMLGLTMKDIDKQIARWEERLAMKEEQLRRQFTVLEEMLGALQSQAAWLAGQIASLEALSGASQSRR